MRPLDQRPLWVAGLLALLFVPQAIALGKQFDRGFVPFRKAPLRIPLSWDMFAIQISRCDLRWDPPLSIGGKKVRSLADAGTRIEWDPTYDVIGQYNYMARHGCRYASGPTVAHVTCFSGDASDGEHDFPCP